MRALLPARSPALQPRPRRRPGSGLTLLELVMTLAVLAVLGTLALPNLGTQLEHQRLRDAAQTLAGDIAEARFLAAQRATVVHLQASPGVQTCWAVSFEVGCDCKSAAQCSVHTSNAVDHPGVQLQSALSLSIDATGTPAAAANAVLEAPHGESLRVDVSPLGRPHICALSGAWPQIPNC